MTVMSTPLGALYTIPVAMGDLEVGQVIVSDDGRHVYTVTGDCDSNPDGWLFVRDLNTDPSILLADGTPAADGFFSYALDTPINLVVGDAQ
jgi:hypothetical protein